MSRRPSPEKAGRTALDRSVSSLLKRRRWKGNWELFDQRGRRPASWPLFHNRANSEFAATTAADISGKTWWITATYGTKGDPLEAVSTGLVGLLTLGVKLNLRISNVDPRTLDVPAKAYNETGGNVQQYISSHKELKAFLAAHS